MKRVAMVCIAALPALAAGQSVPAPPSAAAYADRCTFDLKAISHRVYGGGGDNLATNPNFTECEDPKAPTSWRRLSTSFPAKGLDGMAAADLKKKIE